MPSWTAFNVMAILLLTAHAVSWVQVFDSKTDAPPEEGAAIITRLDFALNDPEEDEA